MMLRPDAVVTSVTEVTPDFLRAHGARAVMVDLDDTLLAAGSDLLEPGFRDWLVSLRAARIPVVILSNGAHTRVTRWAQELELVGLSLTGKPWGRAFRRGLAELGTPRARPRWSATNSSPTCSGRTGRGSPRCSSRRCRPACCRTHGCSGS